MNESIGECEVCGLVYHHLVKGLCFQCEAKSTTIPLTENTPTQNDFNLIDIESFEANGLYYG